MYNILGYDRNSEIFAAVPKSRLTINTAILARVAIGFYSRAKFWEDSISLEERVFSTARSDSRLNQANRSHIVLGQRGADLLFPERPGVPGMSLARHQDAGRSLYPR
jgi:hypothetical protein